MENKWEICRIKGVIWSSLFSQLRNLENDFFFNFYKSGYQFIRFQIFFYVIFVNMMQSCYFEDIYIFKRFYKFIFFLVCISVFDM